MSGAIFSLFAIGLVVLYSVSGVFNFAHGAIAFLAGLLFYQVVLGLGLPKPVAFVIVMFVFAPLLGMLLEKAVFRDLAKAPEAQRIVGSVGLALALPAIGFFLVELCINTFGWDLASMEVVQSVPGLGPDVPVFFDVGPVRVSSNQLIVLGVTALCGIIVAVIMARTRFGLETHAVVDRRSLATMRGINAARLSRLGWILGTMLGAIAGIVSGPMFGLNQSLGLHFVIASSAVVVIAKFRSLKVAMFGGLLLGAASNLFIGYIDEVPGIGATIADLPGLSVSTVYIILFAALAWRGRTNVRIGSTIPDPVPVDHLEGLSRFRRWWPWVVFGAVLASWQLGIIPIGALQAGGIERALMVTGLAYGIVYLSFTVVLGMAGRVSMAQAALVTAAQLSAGFVVGHRILGGGFLISLIVGVTVAALLGAVVALPALRLGGTALAMATLALALIGDQMLFRIDSLRNSTRGWTLSRPALGPLNLDEDHHYAILVALFLLGAIWVVTNLRESATGRSLLATRTSPEAAASVGISSRRATLTAFAISGALAGLGGVLLGFGSKIVNESTYPAMTGLLWLAVAVSWGVRRPASAVLAGMLGAFFPRMLSTGFLFIPETDSAQIPMILFGLGAVGLAKDPDGVVSTVSGALARRRRRRAGATEEATTPPANGVQAASGTPTSVGATAPPSSPVRASDAALVVQGLRAGYAGVEVLHGVDLVVPRGEIVGLIGPNGAGKSTLAAALAGVVETTHGDLRLEGVDIFPLSSYERARAGLAVVPESRGIFPKLTVEENLLVTLADRADHDAVYQRFPILGERRQQPAGNLSGGEQQMLTLAPFLARPPRVLVVDEPTLGLAPRIVGEVLEVLSQLRDEGSSILIIEEQARHILRLADRLTLVSLGTTTWTGAVAEFDADLMADAYLGVTRDERGRSGGREDAGPPRMSIDDHMATDEGRT